MLQVVFRPDVYERNKPVLKHDGMLVVTGVVQRATGTKESINLLAVSARLLASQRDMLAQ